MKLKYSYAVMYKDLTKGKGRNSGYAMVFNWVLRCGDEYILQEIDGEVLEFPDGELIVKASNGFDILRHWCVPIDNSKMA